MARRVGRLVGLASLGYLSGGPPRAVLEDLLVEGVERNRRVETLLMAALGKRSVFLLREGFGGWRCG